MRRWWVVPIGVIAFSLSMAGGARAGGNPFIVEPEQPAFTASFALRYWDGMGSVGNSLYGFSRDMLVARLTYSGLQSHSAEASDASITPAACS
jgi:hypothetical protein